MNDIGHAQHIRKGDCPLPPLRRAYARSVKQRELAQ